MSVFAFGNGARTLGVALLAIGHGYQGRSWPWSLASGLLLGMLCVLVEMKSEADLRAKAEEEAKVRAHLDSLYRIGRVFGKTAAEVDTLHQKARYLSGKPVRLN